MNRTTRRTATRLLTAVTLLTLLGACTGQATPPPSGVTTSTTGAPTSPISTAPPARSTATTSQSPTTSANPPPGTTDPLAPVVGPVVGVYDGDTFTVVIGGEKESVRPLGIDAPELENKSLQITGECYGEQSRDAARALLTGTTVRLTVDPKQGDAKDDYRDQYGRLLRYVQVPLDTADVTTATDTVDFGDYQIRHGNAWVYEQYPVERTPDYMTEMQQAQQTHEGLWAACE